jgi:O-antigen/teichoic acid export membrane protein
MNKYRRLGKNTLFVFIGNASSKLIGLLMLPFYTRWLSVEDYGTTDIIGDSEYDAVGATTTGC